MTTDDTDPSPSQKCSLCEREGTVSVAWFANTDNTWLCTEHFAAMTPGSSEQLDD